MGNKYFVRLQKKKQHKMCSLKKQRFISEDLQPQEINIFVVARFTANNSSIIIVLRAYLIFLAVRVIKFEK